MKNKIVLAIIVIYVLAGITLIISFVRTLHNQDKRAGASVNEAIQKELGIKGK